MLISYATRNKKELLANEKFQKSLEKFQGYDFYSHGDVRVYYERKNSKAGKITVFFYHIFKVNGRLNIVDKRQILLPQRIHPNCFDKSEVRSISDDKYTATIDCIEVELVDNSIGCCGKIYIARDFIVSCDVTHCDREAVSDEELNVRAEIIQQIIDIHQKQASRLNVKVRKTSYTFGADPEFIVMKGGSYVSASSHISSSLENEIGCDGAGYQLELRPCYATSPRALVKNFKEILKKFVAQYQNYDIVWDGDYQPLGGHVHISIFDRERRDAIIKELDKLYMNVMSQYDGRARGSYGRAGAYRNQEWGFEYRSFSSYFWISQETAIKTLAIVKKIVEGAKYEDLSKEVEDLSASLAKPWNKSLLQNWGIVRRRKKINIEIRYSSDCEMSDEFCKRLKGIKILSTLPISVRIIPAKRTRVGVASFKIKHASTIDISDFGLAETSNDKRTINVAIHYYVRKTRNKAVLDVFFNAFQKYIRKIAKNIEKGG